jgi:hypothetical protein
MSNTYAPSDLICDPVDGCGGPMRGNDSGHHICLYCRLPDLLDHQLHMVAAPLLDLCAVAEGNAATEDESGKGYDHEPHVPTAAIRTSLASHREPGAYFPAAFLSPGDQAVSDDRLTMARFIVLTKNGRLQPTIGIARRDSTMDTWPRLDFMAIEE